MEKGSIWMTVLVSAVVAIVSSLATLFFVNSPSFAPRALVNANSCSADAVCETTSIVSNAGATFGNLDAGGQTGGGMFIDGSQVSFRSPVSSGIQVIGDIPDQPGIGVNVLHGLKAGNLAAGTQVVGGGIYVDGYQILARSPVTITNLAGAGEDFVCVDPIGLLFRSSTPC